MGTKYYKGRGGSYYHIFMDIIITSHWTTVSFIAKTILVQFNLIQCSKTVNNNTLSTITKIICFLFYCSFIVCGTTFCVPVYPQKNEISCIERIYFNFALSHTHNCTIIIVICLAVWTLVNITDTQQLVNR